MLEDNFLVCMQKLMTELSADLLLTIQLTPFNHNTGRYELKIGEANDAFWMSTVKQELSSFGTNPCELSLTPLQLEEINALLPELLTRHEAMKVTKAQELKNLTQEVLVTLRTLCKQLQERYAQSQGWVKNTMFYVNTITQASKPTAGKISPVLADILDATKPFSHEQAEALKTQLANRREHVTALKEKDPARENELSLLGTIIKQLETYLDLVEPAPKADKTLSEANTSIALAK